MKALIKLLAWAFIISFAFVLQVNHFLSFDGVNPNLILLLIFLAVILKKSFRIFLFLLLIIILLSVIFYPYWLKEISILAGLGIAGFFLKRFLTGNDFFDFAILVLLGTLGFYLINSPQHLASDYLIVLGELIYNLAFGILVLFCAKIFSYEKETGIKF